MTESSPDADNRSHQSLLATKLSFPTKLAYGAGDLGTAITANVQVFFLLIFFTNVAGMEVGLAGWVLLIGKIWDAVNDPMVGVLSDRTRSRWGRRYPWMIYGAIPFGIFFFLQWIVPSQNQWVLFWYYVIIAVIFNTFYTIVNLPYTALTPELTQDYHERTSLNSFRFAFSIGGSILSLILAQVIFAHFKPEVQYIVLGAICAVISTLPIFWCVIGTWKRGIAAANAANLQETEESLPILTQLRIAFSNRPFLYVIGIYLFTWLALQNTASIIPYFVVNWMGMATDRAPLVALAVQGTALLMLFVWNAISRKIGKKAVLFMGVSLWLIAQIGLFLIQPGQVGLLVLLAAIAGLGVSTVYLVPWSMIPDVIDLDELNTGQRREGIFYGFMVLLQKVGLALGLLLVGQALSLAGFVESVAGQPLPVQPPSALLAIRLAIGPLPALALVFSLVLAYFYPISQEAHTQILLKLQERKQAKSSPEVGDW